MKKVKVTREAYGVRRYVYEYRRDFTEIALNSLYAIFSASALVILLSGARVTGVFNGFTLLLTATLSTAVIYGAYKAYKAAFIKEN